MDVAPPVFRRFNDIDRAQDLLDRLKNAGLHAFLTVDEPAVDPLLVGNGAVWYLVKLPASEFETAETLLFDQAKRTEMPEDHYLHGFTEEELVDILAAPDEWSAEDVAQVLLHRRGRPLPADTVA